VPPNAHVWPTGEIELPRFYILDEHEFPCDKTGKKVKLTKERLEKIAARCNSRGKELDSLVPIIPGHTIDDAPETDQPPIVGYAVDFRVEPFFNTGRYAIACTPLAKSADHVRYFKAMPRRSVELWLDPDDIDPIAILGATTPRRDLGNHRFSRLHRFSRDPSGPQSPYSYVLSEPTPTMYDNPTMPPGASSPGGSPSTVDPMLVKEVAAAVMQLPFLKQLEEVTPLLMSMLTAQSGAGAGGEGDDLLASGEDGDADLDQSRGEGDETDNDEPEPDENGDDFDEGDEDKDEPEDEDEDEEKPNKKNASHCGPNNTSLPSTKMSRRNPADAFRDEAIVAWYANKYGHNWTPPSARAKEPTKLSKPAKSDKITDNAIKMAKKDQDRTERVKMQKALDAATARIAELEQKDRINEVLAELRELDELGVKYNPEREIKRLVKMSREDRAEEIANYKLIATGSKPQPPTNSITPESTGPTKFERGGAKAPETDGGPKDFAQAYEMATAVGQGKMTPDELFSRLQANNNNVRISASGQPLVPTR
jgi:hypothetical protein